MTEIWAVLEYTENTLSENSGELLAELAELAQRQPAPTPLCTLILTTPDTTPPDTTLLTRFGVQHLYLLQHPMLAHWLGKQDLKSYFQGASGRVATLSDREILLTRRAYFGLIAEIDVWVGRVLKALREHYGARDPRIIVDAGPLPTTYHVRWPLPDNPPLVSIVVPTRDGFHILERALGHTGADDTRH